VGLTPRAGSSPAFGTMFFVYALNSLYHNSIYVGITEGLHDRIKRHNKGYVKSTKRFAPFELFYYETCEDGKQAREREKFLKSTSGKRFLKSILNSKKSSGGIGR
jgi:putative endonuclease